MIQTGEFKKTDLAESTLKTLSNSSNTAWSENFLRN